MADGILAQSYMDLPGTPMLLATTIRYLIVIFNPMANFDFECFRKLSSFSSKSAGQNADSKLPPTYLHTSVNKRIDDFQLMKVSIKRSYDRLRLLWQYLRSLKQKSKDLLVRIDW
jgi:hypothetical protein